MTTLPDALSLQLTSYFAIRNIPIGSGPIREIARICAEYYGISLPEILGHIRDTHFCRARHMAIYLASKFTGKSSFQIASVFGGRDHSTIRYGRLRAERKILDSEWLHDAVVLSNLIAGRLTVLEEDMEVAA